MFKKIAMYGSSVALLAAFAFLAGWDDSKSSPVTALRADVAPEPDVQRTEVAFLTDYEAAKRQAARENKPALIFFMSKSCRFSANMREGAFLDPGVEELAKDFICVQVDVNDPVNDDICDEYNVDVSPTIQFVTARGELLQRLTSEQDGEALADQMRAALTSVAWRAARAEARGSTLLR